MIITKDPYELNEYAEENSVLVIPITKHVRKDGKLVFIDENSKALQKSYQNLSKKWGYMIQNDVVYPYFTSGSVNLIGIPEKNHYASAFNEDMFVEGMWYLRDKSFTEQDKTFYLVNKKEYNLEFLKEVFKYSNNIVLLDYERENNE